jgi:hypothetical protein
MHQLVLQPIVGYPSASVALNNACFFSLPEMIYTGLFSWKALYKVD